MILQYLLTLLTWCYTDYGKGTRCFSATCKVDGFKGNLRRQHEDKAPTPWGEGITQAGE